VLRGVGLDFELPTAKTDSGIEISPADIGFNFGTEDPTADDSTTEDDACPQVWYDISRDLKRSFSGCNQLAANAIRFAFHDAGRHATSDRT
jgi:hypothetical protein